MSNRKCQWSRMERHEECNDNAEYTCYSNSHGNEFFLCQKHFIKAMKKAGMVGIKGIEYII